MKQYINEDRDLLVLAPYVRVGFQDGILFLGFGSIQQRIIDTHLYDLYLSIAFAWKNPCTISAMKELLLQRYQDAETEINEAINNFINGNFLINSSAFDREDRFSRHSLFYAMSGANPNFIQETLQKKHVAILGSGGIGNLVAVSLATMGIGELTLVDGDIIELSNLSRQIMFTEDDTGKRKVDVLKKAINERSSKIIINTIFEPVTLSALKKLPKTIDLLVLSADTVGLIWQINQFSIEHKIPFVNIGYIQDIALFGPFVIPGKTGCYGCRPLVVDNQSISSELKSKVKVINEGYQAPSIGPINMMAASYGTLDIIKYLGDFGSIHSLNKRIGIWTNNFRVEIQDCSKNPKCVSCGQANEVECAK